MLQTPLAVLRRASSYPQLQELAARLGTSKQRLNAVESGRTIVSDEFLERLAKEIGFRPAQVIAAYLEGRRARLRAEVRAIESRLTQTRPNGHPARRKSA
jgi:transcriptional regulator with XRE-family HTH domain